MTDTTIQPANPAEIDAEIAEAQEAENLLALETDQLAHIQELRFLRAERKRLTAREDELSAEIKTLLAGYKGATYAGRLVATLADRAGQRRIDADKLRVMWPEAYAACVKQGARQIVLQLPK